MLYEEIVPRYVAGMLGQTLPLALSIMGRPVLIQAGDPALRAALADAYPVWPAGPADGPPITLAITLAMRTGNAAGSAQTCIEVQGSRLLLSGDGIGGWADASTLSAACTVPESLLGEPARLAEEVTDTLLLFLLTRSGRVPLHAAAFVCGDIAVLLAGPSGSGKSTLTLAAMSRGLRILSDDTVYIQLQPRLRIWGFPRPAHVFPADAPGFIGATRLRGGKLKAAIKLPPWREPPVADQAALVLLTRGNTIQLEPVAQAVAAASLSRLDAGFDLLAQESAQAIAAITAHGAWHLTLAQDPDAAIQTLLAGGWGKEGQGALPPAPPLRTSP
jgi:hypothetical protein